MRLYESIPALKAVLDSIQRRRSFRPTNRRRYRGLVDSLALGR